MYTQTLTVGAFQENCYLIQPDSDSPAIYIIDPGEEANHIIEVIEQQNFEPQAILLTHAHLDHIKATGALCKHFGIDVFCHADDVELFKSPLNDFTPYLARDVEFPEPKTFEQFVGEREFQILHTPGHTQGGCLLYFEAGPLAFSGDTIFQGSVGRTDLPGGDHTQLIASIKREVFSLPPQTRLYPGHGPFTTVKNEINNNPYLQD